MRSEFLFIPHASRPHLGAFALYELHGTEHTRVSNKAERLGLPPGKPGTISLYGPHNTSVVLQEAPCLYFTLPEVVGPFIRFASEAAPTVQEAIIGYGLAARLACTAVIRQEVVPSLTLEENPETAAMQAAAIWQLSDDPTLAQTIASIAQTMPYSALCLPTPGEPGSMVPPEDLITSYVNAVIDMTVRANGPEPSGRPRERILPWTVRWQEGLSDPNDPAVPLKEDTTEMVGAIQGWRERLEHDDTLILEVTAPDQADGPWFVAAKLANSEGEIMPAVDVWSQGDAVRIDTLLAGLSRASRVCKPIDELLNDTSKDTLEIDVSTAWELMVEAAPLLRGSGISLVLPATLTDDAVTSRIDLALQEDGLVRATWSVTLDGDALTDADLDMLDSPHDHLIFAHGKWIRLDDASRDALAVRGKTATISKTDALTLSLAGSISDDWFGAGTAAGSVHVDDQLGSMIATLKGAGDLEELQSTPEGFVGELRDYQRRGVAWLRGMTDLGLGAVLADSMGLGKTIQLIALLVSRPGPFLVVCPTSVVGNWEREIQRFSPDLPVQRHHGPERVTDLSDVTGVVVTSYGTLRRDITMLKEVDWDIITLDEAQHIKNPTTAAAKAVRTLTSNSVIALTGTPLENRLSELWAIIDATNHGLLGTKTTFSKRFVAPVEIARDPESAQRLRRLVAPFVMRRTKDDPDIAKNLPDKIYRNVYCSLTTEQAELYDQVTQQSLKELSESNGMQRRGRILKLLTSLKQVTNHPAQYLGQEMGPVVGRSGKFTALQEILNAARDADESTLVFTQFVTMGKLLAKQLSEDLDAPVPFLHGGLTVQQRDHIVENFQTGNGPGVLIVSTRAGGTGLNLTAATHVVHYDHWWNPAVEDQATDRAHRIGQTKTVEVHKLIVMGTIEDRIEEMLERKRHLADIVVADGEAWLTELDQTALDDLVRLGANVQIHDNAADDNGNDDNAADDNDDNGAGGHVETNRTNAAAHNAAAHNAAPSDHPEDDEV